MKINQKYCKKFQHTNTNNHVTTLAKETMKIKKPLRKIKK